MGDLKQLDIFKVPLKGISLVEASAGTGKTYNIASLYVRAILELGLEPSQILVMTFTEAATAELKSRLRDRIKESLSVLNEEMKPKDAFFKALLSANYEKPKDRLKKALDTFDEASVFTIHGFCNRLLTEYSVHFDVPSNVELLTNADELLQECVDEYWLEFNRKAEPDTIEWFALSYLLETGFGPDELKKLVEDILDESNSRIVPELDLQSLESDVNQLKDVYYRAKEQWKDEKEQLNEILFSGYLHGGKFKKDKLEDYWEALTVWIERSEFTFKYPSELQKFSLYLYESLNKSAPDYQILGICQTIDKFIELAEGLSIIKVAFISESISAIRNRFKASKQSRQVLSYDDMLTTVEEGLSLKTSASLRKRLSEKFPFALVDEFQDTDHTQYSILKSIYQNRKSTGLFMIGDPKQAIYSFRGADVYTYLEAKSDLTNDQAYGLMENYRSNRAMIAGVNQLFAGSQHSFIDKEIQFQPASFPKEKDDINYIYDVEGNRVNPLQFLELSDNSYTSKKVVNEDIYSALTREILELISGNYKVKVNDSDEFETVKEKHIAILVWKGADGEKIQDVLRNVGIKSVLRSNTSVFSTEVSTDLFRVLNAVQNLTYEPGIKAALVGSLIGFNAKDLKDLEENEDRWGKLIADLSMIRDEWNKHGIDRALHLFFDQFAVYEALSGQHNAERKLSNLLHLAELLSKESRDNRFSPNALIRWYYSKINEEAATTKAKDEEQLRLESDDELVQITTMHSSKGLQYPIVFCPFLWSSKVISGNEDVLKLKKDGSTIIDLSGKIHHEDKSENVQLAREQNKAEDVRLAYVSLTRSVSACYVFLPNYNKIHNSPISYILNGNNISESIDFNSIRSDLETKGEIEIRKPVQTPGVYSRDSEKDIENLKALSFKRKDLLNHPRMLSYSALVSGHAENGTGKDHDEILIDNTGHNVIATNLQNRFSFPKGANAGSFLHQIFEELNFDDQSDLEKLIKDNLLRFGFEEQWQEPVKKWIEKSVQHNLGNPNTSLSALSENRVIKEMEFFFPVNNLQTSEIWRLIRLKHSDHNDIESYNGFLKGYIDLIFEWQGKFYILDYKSNHLGNHIDDYSEEALNNAVMDAGYDLQYHLYTLALHRYLSSRVVDYAYEDHFGGVLYLFLRGIDLSEPGSGIYFDRPEPALIRSLSEIMKGGVS